MAKNGNICGNTPNETKISKVNFDNSTDQLFKLFSDRVKDHDSNGRIFGKKLTDNVLGRMSTAQLKWRSAIDERKTWPFVQITGSKDLVSANQFYTNQNEKNQAYEKS